MSTLIRLRRSAVPGRAPSTAQLELGEIALNTADGKIYIKQYDSVANTESIVEFSADPNDLLALIKTVDGANSGLDADLFDGLDSTQFLRSDQDDTMDGSLVVTGDLTVSGNTTYVNTETINLSDNIITLNANHTGSPTQNAGIEVERGTSNTVTLQWNEAGDYWEIASGGVTGRILTTGDEGAGNGIDSDTLDGQEGTYYLDYNNFTNVPPATLDLTLAGKVTGNAFSNTGVMTLTTELANTGVIPGTYGTPSQIPVITIDEDGRITVAGNTAVAGVDDTAWYQANNTYQIVTGDGSFFNTAISNFDLNVDFGAGIDVTGDITVTGNVDGRDVSVDGDKLDLIEDGATADQTAAEILTEIKTVDGANSGLDADLLDGQEGTYYLDFTNSTNKPDPTLSLAGDVTGSATFTDLGNATLTADIANTGVVPGSYGTASQIPIVTVGLDGRITSMSNTAVAGVDDVTWYSANSTLSIQTGDGSVFKNAIDEFDEITVNGDVIVTGLVDGRDIALDGAKLDTLEDGLDLTLTGKVTGTATSNTGVMTIATELANTGVTAGVYGTAIRVPILTVDEDGRITAATDVPSPSGTTVSDVDWVVANNTLQIALTSGVLYNTLIEDFTALDADTLDGLHAADNTAIAANNVGNGTISIEANTGLTGSGTFTLNQYTDLSIDIEHADTSSVADTSNADGNVLSNITFDTFGHVQTISSLDLDTRFYTENELDNGQLDDRYYTETELNSGTLDFRYYTEVELNAGALDSRYYTESELNLGQLDNRYYTETELNNGALDGRYYTETESGALFVNVSGDTMTGDLTVSANVDITGTLTAGVIDRDPNITVVLSGDIAGSGNTTLTNLGNGTLNIATAVQPDSVELGTDTTGAYVESVANTVGIVITGTTGEAGVPIIGHADTSSVIDVSTSGKDVISSIDFDTFGHVTAHSTRTLDYITEAEADIRYVNVTGDTMTGDLVVNANIDQSHARHATASYTSISTSTVGILTFNASDYNSAEVVITATQGINRHITKLLVVHNGTTASATEFGSIATGFDLALYDVTMGSGNLTIQATPASASSTTFKIVATLIED